MARYLAQRIIDGAYTYAYVIGRREDLRDGINAYLTEKGKEDLIVSNP